MEWGELLLVELVDVLVDESRPLVLVPLDSVQGGDVTVPRNLRSIFFSGVETCVRLLSRGLILRPRKYIIRAYMVD